ncbi:MAG TPA: hypothetical protein VN372_02435 [Methanospirillum sp.]|nr:hypothetical protein [Methanospirillum sp.]
MYYRIKRVNNLEKSPKNTSYEITRREPRTYKESTILIDGCLGTKNNITAYAEGMFATFDLASQEIPDEYEDDGTGIFTDPRPVITVADWLQEDIEDIRAMSESVIETYIKEVEEDADTEGVILEDDVKAYVHQIRTKQGSKL